MPAPFTLGNVTAADFEAGKDESFRLAIGGQEFAFKLAEVRKLGRAKREGGAFSLIFVTGSGPFLRQGVYPLEHPTIGKLDIFLVPLGPVEGGNSYEAVFT
jgi:hypothetical protein